MDFFLKLFNAGDYIFSLADYGRWIQGEILLFYYPVVWFAGVVKLALATKWGTALALIPILLAVLVMRGPEELEREIAERKKIEAQLRASKERFQSFMNHTPAITFIKDRDGRYVWVNQRFRESFSEFADEFVGKTDEDIWPAVAPALRALDEQVLREEKSVETLETTPHRGRERQWLSFKFPMRGGNGEVLLGGVALDVTDRLSAELALQMANANLQHSNRELQDFAHVASHDLQEPLRKIQAFGDRLAAKYGDQLDETGRDYLQRMQNAAARMQNLVGDLLDLSRISTRMTPFKEVDLNQVARGVLDDLEELVRRTGGRVETSTLPNLEGDPMQLRQLLQNLIGNALKFHHPDVMPLVKVYCAPSTIGANRVRIVVEDNGIGIEEKYLDRIFQPFQRLHGRYAYEGTGIGLAICRKIVERHEGELSIKSTPGHGSRFLIDLPLTQPGDSNELAASQTDGYDIDGR